MFVCPLPYAVADIWMMIYVLSLRRVPCSCPGSVLVVCCRVEVWHILFMLVLSLFSLLCSGMYSAHYKCSTFVVYGRFFAREYLYIA